MNRNITMSISPMVHIDVVCVHFKSVLCVGEEHVMNMYNIVVFIMY